MALPCLPALLTTVLLASTPDSSQRLPESPLADSTTLSEISSITTSLGWSYGGLFLPATIFGSGLHSRQMVQGASDLPTRTLGAHFGLSGEHVGGSLELLWLRGEGTAPPASIDQFPTHGESLSGFIWGGSLDVFGAPAGAGVRPVASVGLRYLLLHRRLDHDTLRVGTGSSAQHPSLETPIDQTGYILDLSVGARFRLGQVAFLESRIGALAGDALRTESPATFSLDDSRHLDPYLRFGLFLDGLPGWARALRAKFHRSPDAAPIFTPL